ncbi:hypothetical protein PsorP6_017459 [Peronosclerospora sorghi]|uniref:Uncharacterized protein n=1 Tax=Peronosclerospora sorghi TaxID=230839 RepID=A0ACC0WP04_9STRA|nr:hypothetical protein PsorP6_017459 [Peronosclerospora sorghi]
MWFQQGDKIAEAILGRPHCEINSLDASRAAERHRQSNGNGSGKGSRVGSHQHERSENGRDQQQQNGNRNGQQNVGQDNVQGHSKRIKYCHRFVERERGHLKAHCPTVIGGVPGLGTVNNENCSTNNNTGTAGVEQ